eukprot:4769-Heterococcus_DN1.PRE.3
MRCNCALQPCAAADAVGTALQGQRAPPLPGSSSHNTNSDGLDNLPSLGSGLLSGKLTIRLSSDLAVVGADVRRVSRSAASLAAVGSTARPHAAAAMGAVPEHSSAGAASSGQRSSLKVTTAGFATSSATSLGSPIGAVTQRHGLLSSPLQVKQQCQQQQQFTSSSNSSSGGSSIDGSTATCTRTAVTVTQHHCISAVREVYNTHHDCVSSARIDQSRTRCDTRCTRPPMPSLTDSSVQRIVHSKLQNCNSASV